MENIKQEMNRLNVNISGICEMRVTNNTDFVIDKHACIYAGKEKNERTGGLILDEHMKKWRLWYDHLSKRIFVFKLKGKLFNITVIMTYAPTVQSIDEILKFYTTLDNAKAQCK